MIKPSDLGIYLRSHRVQARLALRVTVAAVAALAVAQLLHMPLPLWAVLTAIIVTHMSVGRSLKATIDYLAGTLGGAIYGAAIAILVPHSSEAALLGVVALAIAPLALVAAVNPSLNVAPVTAVIVILLPTITHASPIASALDRALEVSLGGLIGFAVSFLVLRSSAHRLVLDAGARTLDQIAQAFSEILDGLRHGLDVPTLHRLQNPIGHALAHLTTIGAEAERERVARLAAQPATGPLVRTLTRLRHDLVMVGRVCLVPLPAALQAPLEAPLGQIREAMPGFLRACGAALRERRPPPTLDAVNGALAAYAAAVAAIRAEGLTRALPGDGAERFFALGFVLEQMRQNFRDLAARVSEWAETPP